MIQYETPLPQLAQALAQHGLSVSYQQLWMLVSAGILPVTRKKSRVFAVGDPADLAAMIRPHLNSRKRAA